MELKMAFHGVTGRRIVEVFDNRGEFVAGIYPDEITNGIRIVSKHIATLDLEPRDADGVGGLRIHFLRDFER